ncbi:MAG: hypothetical protein AMXMBFR4_31120 [Candidatus Hydrogenedentota bacterium]
MYRVHRYASSPRGTVEQMVGVKNPHPNHSHAFSRAFLTSRPPQSTGATGEKCGLVPFDKERDVALLAGWLCAPPVSRWWGDPEKKLADAPQSPRRGDHTIITVGDRAVGYLRWERISRADLEQAGLFEIPVGADDIRHAR